MFTVPVVKRGKKKQFERIKAIFDKPEVLHLCFAREKPSKEDIKEWEVRKKMGQNPKNPYDHYHVLMQLGDKKRRSQIQEWLGGKYHEEGKVWDYEAARHYVMKGICGVDKCTQTWKRHGDKQCHEFRSEKIPSYSFEAGKWTKERSNSRAMASLMETIDRCDTWSEVLDEAEPQTLKGCMTYAKEVFYNKPPRQMELQLRSWQQEVYDILKQQPDDRTIYWITDKSGNSGKSKLAKYLCTNDGAIMLNGENGNDMLYAYAGEKIIIVNIPRHSSVDYGAIEQLKDGLYFAGKYQSKCVNRPYEVQIICFSNGFPSWDLMSHDRWHAWLLDDGRSPEEQYYLRAVWNTGKPDLELLKKQPCQQTWVEMYEKKNSDQDWIDGWTPILPENSTADDQEILETEEVTE